jgi:hypothetical protein
MRAKIDPPKRKTPLPLAIRATGMEIEKVDNVQNFHQIEGDFVPLLKVLNQLIAIKSIAIPLPDFVHVHLQFAIHHV